MKMYGEMNKGLLIDEAQKKAIMIQLMDEIDSYCRTNKLTYFLVGGTLLGAIRHKGFIPWDDDIDIGLPRGDYEELIKNFKSTTGNVEIRFIDNQKSYMWPNAKAIDNRTVLVELGNAKSAIGVNIDIFPFDFLPGDYDNALKIVKKHKKWKDALLLKHMIVDKNRPFLKNMIVIAGKLLFILPDSFFINRINDTKELNKDNCEYICNLCGAWGLRELSSSKNFVNTIEAPFEDRKYMIPVGFDNYLTTVYGDYMTPPPAEKQITHHSSESYWKEKK